MDDFYMDIRKFIKENYSEYKESIETEENNYDIKNSKKTNENIENEEKYRNLYNNYKKLSEKIYGKNDKKINISKNIYRKE